MTETSSHPAADDLPAAPEVPVPAIPVPEVDPADPADTADTVDPVAPAGPVSEVPGPGLPATPEEAPPAAAAVAASITGYRMAIVTSVTVDLPVQHPTVVLRETESPRRQLSFSVGLQDGIAISQALRRIPTPRPLTHELVADVLQAFDVDVVAVRLVGRQGSTYFAELDLRGPNGRSVHSCRPSDAVAIALRQPVPVPILIDSRLFEVLGDVAPL
ncbi:MAG TPA: bifunctional nuclease family protein [Acidimicrobiales bacterium]|jgi:hypothetical protein|nr:bifunctional nuclease family protein [Acidimicrobiales bacterium]